MSFVNCFDITSMVIDEANARFAPLFRMNRKKQKVIEEYCNALDRIAQEFNGDSFTAEIDESAMTISITMTCPDIVIRQQSHRFYELVERALEVRFSNSEGNIAVSFVFPSIWDRAT